MLEGKKTLYVKRCLKKFPMFFQNQLNHWAFSSEDLARTVGFSTRKLKLVANDSEIKENKIILMSPGLLNVFCSGGQNDK